MYTLIFFYKIKLFVKCVTGAYSLQGSYDKAWKLIFSPSPLLFYLNLDLSIGELLKIDI